MILEKFQVIPHMLQEIKEGLSEYTETIFESIILRIIELRHLIKTGAIF